ncbi:hypothetical protein [Nonomuraea sp. NPDC050310]|uniref:hypothetical protein n=1 Tax=Nonomuraea sp. NPDC050310 TaxID=3154935 RepID=UPI0033C6FE2F
MRPADVHDRIRRMHLTSNEDAALLDILIAGDPDTVAAALDRIDTRREAGGAA